MLRTDMELVLRGHKGRKYCWSAQTDKECCVFVEQFLTILHQTCTYLRLGLLLSYNMGSTCLASFFLSCRPIETQSAVLSVTYIVSKVNATNIRLSGWNSLSHFIAFQMYFKTRTMWFIIYVYMAILYLSSNRLKIHYLFSIPNTNDSSHVAETTH